MSGAGGGGELEAAAGAAEAAADGAEETTTPDLHAALSEIRAENQSRFDALEDYLAARDGSDEEEEPRGHEVPPATYTEDDYNTDGQLTQEARDRREQQLIDAAAERVRNEFQEQRREEQVDAELAEIERQYPDFQDEAKAEKIIEAAIRAAGGGKAGKAIVAANPGLLVMAYEAQGGRKAADREIPAGDPQEVSLERGGGAGPAAAAGEDKRGDAIVGALNRQQFRLGK